MSFEIVLLAMVAAFLGLRLYSVLGKRTGHEQEPMPKKYSNPADDRQGSRDPVHDNVTQFPDVKPAEPLAQPGLGTVYDAAAENGIKAIIGADRNFDVGRFLDGAKAAYGMILEAFWNGDKDELKLLCDEDTYAAFSGAIDARAEAGEKLENRLIRVENLRIVEADYQRPMASITLRFDADIATVVRDKDDNIIGGSLSDAVETHDVWTFSRDLTSADPNWLLDETDEA